MEQHREFMELIGYVYLQQNKMQEARVVYEALHVLFPKNAEIALALAYSFYALGQFKQCLDAFGGVVHDKESLILQSKACWGLGKKDEARALIKTYTEVKL
ncbi:MAG TPA: hypothetical protein DHV51_04070 [Opitutae bacterium]|nr:hypothetical protein [Opitutae bacterium]